MTKIIKINLSKYILSGHQLENLALEYYGKVLTATKDDGKEIEVQFEDIEDTSTTARANAFNSALNNFKKE